MCKYGNAWIYEAHRESRERKPSFLIVFLFRGMSFKQKGRDNVSEIGNAVLWLSEKMYSFKGSAVDDLQIQLKCIFRLEISVKYFHEILGEIYGGSRWINLF